MEEKNKEKYPRGAWYMLANTFLDRFSSSGFLTSLAIYINQKLLFDESMSTALYHLNEVVQYLFAIFGAILADSLLGKYRTILYMTITCLLGTVITTVGSMDLEFLSIRVISFIGMFAVMIGSGGVKSCQNALGGDLFKLPEQAKILEDYFTMQFFILKIGHVGSMTIIPILFSDVKCLGEEDCYPLAYGFASLLALLALIVFWMGRKSYVHNMPGSNVIVEVMSCIFFALKTKIRSKCSEKSHWLDYSEQKFGSQLVKDTKRVLQVLVMYLPLFAFWALINQQMSRWVFQATFMDGNIGNFYTIKPAQMVVVSPFLYSSYYRFSRIMVFQCLNLVD